MTDPAETPKPSRELAEWAERHSAAMRAGADEDAEAIPERRRVKPANCAKPKGQPMTDPAHPAQREREPMITGFEFRIVDEHGERWTRLQGAGGLIGDGRLAALNGLSGAAQKVRARLACRELLVYVMRLSARGPLRECVSLDGPPAQRFRDITVRDVVSCRVRTGTP